MCWRFCQRAAGRTRPDERPAQTPVLAEDRRGAAVRGRGVRRGVCALYGARCGEEIVGRAGIRLCAVRSGLSALTSGGTIENAFLLRPRTLGRQATSAGCLEKIS